jgi:dipeptidase E
MPHFEAADLLCFGGGNEQYLAKVLRDSGVVDVLPKLLETRVYMGISAGSMVAGQFLPRELLQVVYPEEAFPALAPPLAFVELLFAPHLNSEYFSHVRKEVLEPLAPQFEFPLYACDDRSALTVIDGVITPVGDGETLLIKN